MSDDELWAELTAAPAGKGKGKTAAAGPPQLAAASAPQLAAASAPLVRSHGSGVTRSPAVMDLSKALTV